MRYGIWVNGFYVDEKCTLLGCYAASSGNFLPLLQGSLLVLSSGNKTQIKRVVPIGSYVGKSVGSEKTQ
jgi:hypothetical protein